jgi:hypothetical protein
VSGRDASGDGFTGGVSGSEEEAAWRDLIARYELPANRSRGQVPWPEREDLPDDPAAPPGAGGADQADAAGQDDSAGQPGNSGADGTSAQTAERAGDTDGTDHGQDADRPTGQAASFGRTRVIRPAMPPTTPPEATPSQASLPAPSSAPASGTGEPGGPGAAAGSAADTPDANDGVPHDGAPYDSPLYDGDAYDSDAYGVAAKNGAASDGPAYDGPAYEVVAEADDPDEHYIPPPPPPLPHLDPVAKGAWAALFGGPAYLLVSTLVGLNTPGWVALLAVAAFIGGFAVVVLRLGDKPSRGDGPDNGAVL